MSDHASQNPIDTVTTNVAIKVMEGGTVTTAFGWLTSNNGIALMGLLVAILGFGVNLYFQYRRDRREHEFQVEKIALLRKESAAAAAKKLVD